MNLGVLRHSCIGIAALLIPGAASAALFSSQGWGGSVGIGYQQSMVDNTTTYESTTLSASLSGRYYIWQPWFINGSMRITATNNESESGHYKTSNTKLGGALDATVLPQSRFPLSIGYKKTTNTIEDSAKTIGPLGTVVNPNEITETTNYYFIQKYLAKHYKMALSYHVDEHDSEVTGSYVTQRKGFEYKRRDPGSELTLNLDHREDEFGYSDESRDNKMVRIKHDYQPVDTVTIATYASRIEQLDVIDLDSDGISDEYAHLIDQVSSSAMWRSESGATRVNGSVRYTGVNTDRLAQSYEDRSVNISTGVSHRLNDNINFSGSASHGESERNGTPHEQSTYNASANYRSDTIDLSMFNYNWGASASHGVQQSDEGDGATTTLGANHYISRNWKHGRKGQIRTNFNQSYTYSDRDIAEDTARLSNGAQLGYSRNDTAGTLYARINLSDQRVLSGDEETIQMINAQVSRQQKITMRSSVNGSLTYQDNRYGSATQELRSQNATFLVNYTHNMNFSFQTLSFNSTFSYSNFRSNGAQDRDSYSWDNVLKHRIGQLSSSLTLRTQRVDNRNINQIIANVSRSF